MRGYLLLKRAPVKFSKPPISQWVKIYSVFTQGDSLFLPAAGNRNRDNAGFNNVGTNGNYWSSGTTGTNGYNLNFNGTTVNPGNNNNRANGLTVRCVAELNINLYFSWNKSLFNNPKDCGLPIGNLTSQLFSNVYMHDFDCFVKNELGAEYYGRYVDDFVLIHPDKEFLLQAKEKIPHRIYIGNRTKKKFIEIVRDSNWLLSRKAPDKNDLIAIRSSVNSYLGIMKHYKTYNIRKKFLLNKKRPPLLLKYGYLRVVYKKGMVYKIL